MNRRACIALMVLLLCSMAQNVLAQDNSRGTKQDGASCKDRKIDLTGTYTGVLFTDKDQKEGTPAKLTIAGNNRFELASDTLTGAGLVSGVNSCGEVSIALKFTKANVDELATASISLDARVAGGGEWSRTVKGRNRPIIWATAHDYMGKLAGADIAFVICPKYPKCLRYQTCPCPEP